MGSKTLYEITAELRALVEAIADQGGELTDAQEAALWELDASHDQKMEAYVLVRRERLAEAEKLGAEIDRLVAWKKSELNAAENLKRRLEASMVAAEKDSFRTTLARARIQDSNPSVNLLADLASVPHKFIRVIPQTEDLDKKAILESYRNTGVVPTGVAITKGRHIVID